MELEKINTFLRNHTGADFFEVDLKLFIQKFPDSKLIPSFKNAINVQKAQLDERICAEMLMHKDACIDCIWENRGFYVNADGFINPLVKSKSESEFTDAEKALLNFDLTKPDYNEMKKLIFALEIDVKGNSKKDYINALMFKKHELYLICEAEQTKKPLSEGGEPLPASNLPILDTDTGTDTDTDTDITVVDLNNSNATNLQDAPTEKKSEDHE